MNLDIVNAAAEDEIFVWPWMTVLANIVTKYEPKSGKYTGKNNNIIEEELTAKGVNLLKVTTLWNDKGQTHFAIVEFGKEMDGWAGAWKLETSFEREHCGKRDYLSLSERGEKLFGWMARRDDYNSKDIVGSYLRKNGDLKTVAEKEAEDNSKFLMHISRMDNTLKQKNEELEQLTRKYNEKNGFV